MGLLNKLFGKKSAELPNWKEKSGLKNQDINFDLLVEKARTSGNEKDLEELYRSFLNLETWVFLVSENCEIEHPKPFIGILEEQPWLYVFTDFSKADFYAKLFGRFHSKDGNTLCLRMKRDSSLNMAKELGQRGVYGIRVNEGDNGWFCNIQGLFDIIKHLRIDVDLNK